VSDDRAPGLARLAAYFGRLGALGFGGPIALAGAMRRDLVEARGWIADDDYRQGLALAQLAPGPLAAQLAMYLGWVRGRVWGATVVAAAFILPSFAMVLALSAAYVHFGGLAWMQSAFYGVGAAVIAIIARSAWKLGKSTLGRRWLLWAIAAGNAAVVAATEREILWLFVASGVVALAVAWPRARAAVVVPPWLVTGLGAAAGGGTIASLFLFFAQAGAVVFGSGLAIVPFLHGGVVEQHHWLTEQQFLDAVAVAMITPGPVVITVAFIGYLVAGPLGACAAAAGVFLPCWLFVIVPAPYFRRIAGEPRVRAFVDGVTAAAAGAIAGAAVVLGRRAIHDATTAAIAIGALVALLGIKKLPEPVLILAAAAIGIAIGAPA
jgi:chromate transporter